jgi:hypothetical protein
LKQIEIDLRDVKTQQTLTLYIDVFDTSLSRKWLAALDDLLANQYYLEKNFCFLGFANSDRDGAFVLEQLNQTIDAINSADLGYTINDHFTMANTIEDEPRINGAPGRNLIHDRMNHLHRYFEDLQGVSGRMSEYYQRATPTVKWHIRQLNLLCHEFECWVMSWRKQLKAPEWQRPSQLMCWLHAPRFVLDEEDLEFFGIEYITKPMGGVSVGINKAVGKTHWEVFRDEGGDVSKLVTTVMRPQTEASGDFDIEWGLDPIQFEFMQREIQDFRTWLLANGFDPKDPTLTLGHPRVAQTDLVRSFGTTDHEKIWNTLDQFLDVVEIRTEQQRATYNYHWSDPDFRDGQVKVIEEKTRWHG